MKNFMVGFKTREAFCEEEARFQTVLMILCFAVVRKVFHSKVR